MGMGMNGTAQYMPEPGSYESSNFSRDNLSREIGRSNRTRRRSPRGLNYIRPFFILRIVRPIIFESKFRNHCAKKLVGALRKPPLCKNVFDPNSKSIDS